MKAVILAGGLGTRLSEATNLMPKPMVDTGLNTMTGGRIKRIEKYIGNERFLLTYGDGVADLNITDSIVSHEKSGAILSLTAYKPGGKFGALQGD